MGFFNNSSQQLRLMLVYEGFWKKKELVGICTIYVAYMNLLIKYFPKKDLFIDVLDYSCSEKIHKIEW